MRVKWFIQRGRRGWADCDVWSLDGHLARIISEGTKRLEATDHGYPPELTPEEWSAILLRISDVFYKYYHHMELETLEDELKVVEDLKEQFEVLKKYYVHLWD